MNFNIDGSRTYSPTESEEIDRAMKLAKDTYQARGQNTTRTLIDCMNVMLTRCPMSDYAVAQKGINLSFIKDGSELIFQVNECRNIECCYESLLEFIIEKAFPL